MKYRNAIAFGLIAACSAVASAQSRPYGAGEFSLGIGYAHIGIGDSDSALHSEDALRFDPVYSIAPLPRLEQLRLGFAFGVAMDIDNSNRTIIINDGQTTVIGNNSVPLLLLEPELRLSWRQYFGRSLFVEPGVGVGGVFGYLNLEDEDPATNDFEEWESTYSARAFLNVGVEVVGGTAGLQASYMKGGSLDFADNASGDVEEFYIGFFGALRF